MTPSRVFADVFPERCTVRFSAEQGRTGSPPDVRSDATFRFREGTGRTRKHGFEQCVNQILSVPVRRTENLPGRNRRTSNRTVRGRDSNRNTNRTLSLKSNQTIRSEPNGTSAETSNLTSNRSFDLGFYFFLAT